MPASLTSRAGGRRTARTAPSQSASIVLAQAVSAWPTPEAVGAVREAKRLVRHAGLAKKLDRLLRAAEQGLARRPAVALRLPGPGAPTPAQLTTLARALEGGYPLDTHTSYDMFAGHIVAITPLLGLATRQGWRSDHLNGVLRRELGQWRVELVVSGASLFPGPSGFGASPGSVWNTTTRSPSTHPERRRRLHCRGCPTTSTCSNGSPTPWSSWAPTQTPRRWGEGPGGDTSRRMSVALRQQGLGTPRTRLHTT